LEGGPAPSEIDAGRGNVEIEVVVCEQEIVVAGWESSSWYGTVSIAQNYDTGWRSGAGFSSSSPAGGGGFGA